MFWLGLIVGIAATALVLLLGFGFYLSKAFTWW